MDKQYGCGIEAALDVIGGKWKALIIWPLDPGPLRFGELRRRVPGVTEKMLIQQLRELEADGVVHREVYHEVPPKVEYSLTEFGKSLKAALQPLCEWGALHMRRIGARHTCDGGGRETETTPRRPSPGAARTRRGS